MTAPTSQITFGGVAISGWSTLGQGGLQIDYELDSDGWSDLIMSDGTNVRQSFFQKWRITVTGTGTVPPQLRALDLTTTKSLILPDPEDTDDGLVTYTVWATLNEGHAINGSGAGRATWTLVCREA